MADPEGAYLDEAAAILRAALKSAENRWAVTSSTPEDRRELLEARVRVAEGFARLHEAGRAVPAASPGDGKE